MQGQCRGKVGIWALVLLPLLTLPTSVRSDSPSDPPAPSAKDTPAPSAPTPPSAKPGPAARPRAPGQRRYSAKLLARETRQLTYLKEQIQTQTTLSDTDKLMVQRRIERYVDAMNSDMLVETNLYDGTSPEEEAAANAANAPSEQPEKPVRQMPKLRDKPVASPLSTHAPLLRDIESTLNSPESRAQFQAVSKRWAILRYRGGPDGPLVQLMRAVRDPKLELSKEKEDSLRTMLGKIMVSIRAARRDTEVGEAAFREGKEKVVAELSPEQVARLDATLAEITKERETENELGKKLEEKWKEDGIEKPHSPRPSRAPAPLKTPPESSKPMP